MNATEIKALGSIWGGQCGLLSVAELELLMMQAREHAADRFAAGYSPLFLEVGHYHGLSTCAIVHALRLLEWLVGSGYEGIDLWALVTVDSHEPDQWVGRTDPEDYLKNKRAHFNDPRVQDVFVRSQTFTDPVPYDFVFYDGDHGEEQERFTRLVIDSPDVQRFVFDDRDFWFPKRCCELLRDAGWSDLSPPVQRLPGDKTNPQTMTLGVFSR